MGIRIPAGTEAGNHPVPHRFANGRCAAGFALAEFAPCVMRRIRTTDAPHMRMCLSAPDERDDLQAVSGFEKTSIVFRTRHNLQIPLDRQKTRLQIQVLEELSHSRSRLDLTRFFINDNLQWNEFRNGHFGRRLSLPEVYVPPSKTVKECHCRTVGRCASGLL